MIELVQSASRSRLRRAKHKNCMGFFESYTILVNGYATTYLKQNGNKIRYIEASLEKPHWHSRVTLLAWVCLGKHLLFLKYFARTEQPIDSAKGIVPNAVVVAS